ncbi:MAG TPA: diacylglycerol kinase [Candidatus Tumulicola sp.]|jgi:diacylglycerol kinase (ATP)
MRYPQDDPSATDLEVDPKRRRPEYVRIDESKFWRSFSHAFDGIIHATRTQPNMRIHFIIAALVLLATLVLRLERPYVIATVAFVALVLSMELVNTAIEAIVDLLTTAHHPLAKTAKDAAAGAVLVAATGSVIAGYLIFYQGLLSGGQTVFEAVQQVPANIALIVIAVVGIATIFFKARFGRGSALQGGAVSGHAALAFAVATMLALFYRKPLAAALGYFVAFLVAQTRVEARIHSAFEVLWGAVLGTIVAVAIYVLVRPHVVL